MDEQESELYVQFETLASHAGLGMRVGDTMATVTPIVASTTFTYDTIEGVHHALEPGGEGFAYSRNANPTVTALEAALALLEGADEVVAFGSGMSAIHAALVGVGLQAGDTIVASSDLYGVTRSLLMHLQNFDIRTVFVDVRNIEVVERALVQERARILYFESMSNPLVRVSDTPRLAEIARRHGAVSVIDNTFATPYLLRPLAHGIDVVVHSATKFIAGHGDTVAGAVATSRNFGSRIRSMRTLMGGVLSPFEAWLTMRGMRTLPVRMDRHCASALQVAEWLHEQTWVQEVYYPGLLHHSEHDLTIRQFSGKAGGMLSFNLRADEATTLQFMNSLKLITTGTSLGDVESLALYPALSSHRGLTETELGNLGIGKGLVRLSVGLEAPMDLIADLQQAAASSVTKTLEPAGANREHS